MSNQHVVLSDPTGNFWNGAFVSREKATALEAMGATTIPVVPEMMLRNGAGGYVVRSWGAGWPLSQHPTAVAKLLMFCDPAFSRFHWRARIRLNAGVKIEDVAPDAAVRFAPDGAQHMSMLVGVQAGGEQGALARISDAVTIHPSDDSWIVGGEVAMAVRTIGYAGFALFGHGKGLSVEWAAVSQTA
jgi:hypothetical protein